MPEPTSKKQFRFLQAVAHGMARAKHDNLSAASAKKGLAEFKASGKSYKRLPVRKGKRS